LFPAKIEDYKRPKTADQAAGLLRSADEGEVTLIAGGMSLMQAIKARVVQPRGVIDLADIEEMKGIKNIPSGVWIGALTRYVELASSPILKGGSFGAISDAASHVGDRQVRNRGTIGGSLCWNYVAACVPVAVLAIGAHLELCSESASGASQQRSIPIDEFLLAPMETSRRANELLRSITLPDPGRPAGSAYRKWGHATDSLPVVGIGVRVVLGEDRSCQDVRAAIGGLSGGSQRFPDVEKRLLGLSAKDTDEISSVFHAAARTLDVQGDNWASADYRRVLIQEIGTSVALLAIRRAEEGAS
jgi:aerobic carbon-monoxide dehydrogenase medium subunit